MCLQGRVTAGRRRRTGDGGRGEESGGQRTTGGERRTVDLSSTPQRWRAGAMARIVDVARRTHVSLMELLGLMGEGTYPEAYDAVRLAAAVLDEEFDIGRARQPLPDIAKL